MVVRDRRAAVAADGEDPLAAWRERFVLPDGVYLAGNSLGALPVGVADAVARTITAAWGSTLVAGWAERGWWALPGRVGDRIALLLGAAPGQVICGDSTSVQLFQAVIALRRMRPGRRQIVVDAGDFPTDRYLVAAAAGLVGADVLHVDPDTFVPSSDTAVVLFSAVSYATGTLRDLDGITGAVHAAGGLVAWDLSHAAGALPVGLDDLGADAAVGCTYKYLCGGPGAPAYLYVPVRHQAALGLPLTGWQGHADPFGMVDRYRPADGIEQARIGTPPILSMVALERALDVWDGVDMVAVRAKSLALSDLIIAYADTHLRPFHVEVATPHPRERRGSHVALRMPDAYAVSRALIAHGVTGDFRAPDLLRLGLSPLYLRAVDVWDAMEALHDILATGAQRDPALARRQHVIT